MNMKGVRHEEHICMIPFRIGNSTETKKGCPNLGMENDG
jgi:hypothetical protein